MSRLLDTAQDDSDPAYLAPAQDRSESPSILAAGLGVTLDSPRPGPVAQREKEPDGSLTVDSRIRPADIARALTELPPPLPAAEPRGQKWRNTPAAELTQAGAVLGTPLYMAPELASGARGARLPSDIFSFGVMAYEVLTGALPFSQPPPLLVTYGNGELPFEPLDRRCPGLPPPAARALEACLAVNPTHRPTAAELLLTLADCVLPSAGVASVRK